MPILDYNLLELQQEFRHRLLGTVESCLMGQTGQLVQLVRHPRKTTSDGSFLARVSRWYRRLDCCYAKHFRHRERGLSAAPAESRIFYLGTFPFTGFA